MTITELKEDKNFLKGLRKGEYCLVLGAGFSFGLKNKTTVASLSKIEALQYSEYKNIPLINAYIQLTNIIFNVTTSKGEAAANHWENNQFSFKKDNEIFDLKPFYRDLFTLDEDWFKDNEFDNYKSVLIPNWYQIYTFNFDNVFETIVKLKRRESFYSLHFPEHSGIKRTAEKAILHLHGYISETPVDKLTFSDKTYNSIRDTKHTLYDQFYTDVNNEKKLVIIGTQFDEKVIDDKFFSGLENKNITIYHFDLYNDNFITKPGIANNPNYHFIKINDIHEVLDFIEKYKVQIENIKIDGADVINSDFIEKVKQEVKKDDFTASDFYLSKQVDECQWYGVTQNWVIERDNYNFIKHETISSFADEKRNSKISVLVWGLGGSGKSTLLRQLSVDLSNEDFAVLWIKDKSIQNFYDNGLTQMRSEYPHKRFLVVIEDLYRVKQNDVNIKEILNSICSNNNIRLIIGDRKRDDNSYKDHIYNPDKNIVELTVNDNKKTLNKLLGNIPDWKTAAEKLLKSDDDYKSTLYYILWSIGRTAQKEKEGFAFDKQQDLTSHFRSLVQSDLKALTNYYPGVAKMLYFWASIYAKSKIYISYDLFFTLADLFKAPVTIDSKQIHASTTNKAILDIYIHRASGFIKSAGELSLIAFNHDILAEDGLSKSQLNDWHPFDDSIKLTLLPNVIEYGDDFSASSFLIHCLNSIPDIHFSKNDKKKLTDVYRLKNIYIAPAFTKDFYSKKEKYELANEILAQPNFWNLPFGIVSRALNITKDKVKADEILAQQDFWNLQYQIVSTALNISKDKDKADKILAQQDFWKLDKEIVSTALNISKDKVKADKILAHQDFWNMPFGIVSTALNISKDKDKADEILAQQDFWNLPFGIVSTALNISKDKVKADEILAQQDFWNLQYQIVSTALNISKDKDKADKILAQQDFWKLDKEIVSTALNISKDKVKANKILTQQDFWNLDKEIVSTALNISKDKDKADEILAQQDFWNLQYQIVSTALNISKNEALKTTVAKTLFDSGQWKEKWSITYHILYFYSTQKNIPLPIIKICETVIWEYFNRTNTDKGKGYRYINLMKIPLHSLLVWKRCSLENIKHWKNRQRNIVTNTIIAYRSFPSEIKSMCESILINWKTELTKPINQIGRKTFLPHYGDHIRLSLGHPDIEKLIEQKSLEIKELELQSPGLIPEHLMNVINQIVDEGKFPVWISEDNHENE